MNINAVLGVARFHDVGAAVHACGEIQVVAEAERVLDVKHARHASSVPPAVDVALAEANVRHGDVSAIVIADTHGDAIECRADVDKNDPIRGWSTIDHDVLQTTHGADLLLPLGTLASSDRLGLGPLEFEGISPETPVYGVCHHAAHAASAIYMSGFDECVVLVVDGYGVCNGTIAYTYRDGLLERIETMRDAALLGWRYGLFGRLTAEINAKATDNLDLAGKVMGLNAYGHPKSDLVEGFKAWFKEPYDSYTEVFDHGKAWFGDLLAGRSLSAGQGSVHDKWFLDIIASMQEAFSCVISDLAQRALEYSGSRSIVMAGGCALNVLANSRVAGLPCVDRFFVVPCAGDGGLPLGAAVIGGSKLGGIPLHHPDVLLAHRKNPYLGISLQEDIAEAPSGLQMKTAPLEDPATGRLIADMLAGNKLVGVAFGSAELGPRALGHRSILASGIDPAMRDRLNHVKRREWWRPFAPVCRAIDADKYFEGSCFSEYMLTSVHVREEYRGRFSAAAHEDGSARLQIVPSREQNPLLWDVLTAFEAQTGIGVLINTSYNIGGKPLLNRSSTAVSMIGPDGLDAAWVNGRLFQML